MPVSNQNAPFQKSPEFNRDSFLRAPDWRWQEARKIASSQQLDKVCLTQIQPVILYAARLQVACRNTSVRQFIRAKQPDAWQIITLGGMDASSQLKAALQACIIYGLKAQQISDKLKWITPVQAQLYMDLFCDLSGVQGVAQWFQQMLLQPARANRNMNLFRARALAHYHSLQAALHSLRFGNSGKSAKQAMQLMWKDARNRQVFDYMAQNLNVPIQIYVPAMQQALKAKQDRAFLVQNKQQQNDADSAVMSAISASLDKSIRTYTKVEISSFGNQDPANQVIKQIINTNQEKN